MKHYKLLLFIFLALTTSKTTYASTTEGYWLGFFGNTLLSESISIHQEFQIRKNTEVGETSQTLFRGGPLWKWTDSQSLGLLYAHVTTGFSGGFSGGFSNNITKEHRLTQQYSLKWNDALSLRTRVEQRTLEKHNGVNLRLRASLRFEQKISESLHLIASDEFFFHATRPDWIYDEGFDRNRLFLGIRTKILKMSMDIGYLNQYANRAGADLNEHLLLMYLIF